MAKKRTRNRKSDQSNIAKLLNLYEREGTVASTVKGEFVFKPKKYIHESNTKKVTEFSTLVVTLKETKRNIVKSLILVSLILSLELVLYFLWK